MANGSAVVEQNERETQDSETVRKSKRLDDILMKTEATFFYLLVLLSV